MERCKTCWVRFPSTRQNSFTMKRNVNYILHRAGYRDTVRLHNVTATDQALYEVLFDAWNRAGFPEWVKVYQTEVTNAGQVSPRACTDSIKRLLKAGIIEDYTPHHGPGQPARFKLKVYTGRMEPQEPPRHQEPATPDQEAPHHKEPPRHQQAPKPGNGYSEEEKNDIAEYMSALIEKNRIENAPAGSVLKCTKVTQRMREYTELIMLENKELAARESFSDLQTFLNRHFSAKDLNETHLVNLAGYMVRLFELQGEALAKETGIPVQGQSRETELVKCMELISKIIRKNQVWQIPDIMNEIIETVHAWKLKAAQNKALVKYFNPNAIASFKFEAFNGGGSGKKRRSLEK